MGARLMLAAGMVAAGRVLLVLILAAIAVSRTDAHVAPAASVCAARAPAQGGQPIRWVSGSDRNGARRDAWCRAVGPPVVRPSNAGGGASAPALEDLVVVTWNRYLGAGDLEALVGDLVRGRFTDEVPVSRFVILVQEARRAGGEVPMLDAGGEGPERIRQDGDGGDVVADAEALGLSLVYVPSMRNGADVREDRGNAVLSTEPLHTIEAIELPFVRQRRVALGVSLEVTVAGEIASLRLMNLHLDARGTRLGLYGSPRRQQLETVLEWLRASDAPNGVRRAGTVLGGDLNTVQGGDDEPTYRLARAWSVSLRRQDPRDTHASMGRLDYLFFRLPPGWTASTDRLSPRYGSDHHPVMGRFTPP